MMLLSDLEIKRLIDRDSEKNSHTRATNDTRVRKKLHTWLKDTITVQAILEFLPDEQIDKVVDDLTISDLLFTINWMIIIKEFLPIVGELAEPEKWEIVELKETASGK